ncbi:hypothetical protein D3877_19935 [Azospirillum cavernae]|uniref:Uncharacterized protein n=2 Tax=Azospirillum cavernae TaxID=2320860 RepID=A0A418VYX6_9PROT|nr:hypothetical protein D3877_19935 [Azospirillum cavernae]
MEAPLRVDGSNTDFARVTFRVLHGLLGFEVPVLVSLRHYDEADAITIARSYLHEQSATIAAATTSWKLTDTEKAAKVKKA